jgi:hypothetical protein
MALWVCSRNAMERAIPDHPPGTAAQHWKHFACGAVAGVSVQVQEGRPERQGGGSMGKNNRVI